MAKSVKKLKRQIVEKTLNKVERSLKPEMFAEAVGEAIILVLAFEHIDHRHTGAWLRKWLKEFHAFGEAVRESGEPISHLCDILRDECDFDVASEYKAVCDKGGDNN